MSEKTQKQVKHSSPETQKETQKETLNETTKTSKQKKQKLVLAYSGGLDTSVIVKWLEERGYEVICFVADVGQREDYKELIKKAKASGGSKCIVADLKKEFVSDFVYPALQFNAMYEGRYLLGTSLARPIIAAKMVELAQKEGTHIIAHGATGKGNDQVRFELTAYALDPEIRIIAPWRMNEFTDLIKGRTDAIKYAEEHGIPIKATVKKPWSSDENLLHISFEAGMLEDPAQAPQKDMFELTVAPQDAPNTPEKVSIDFQDGIPVSLNGKKLGPVEMLMECNRIAGRNGVGRVDIVESRYVGMKSRGVYETPGGTMLMAAHRDIEGMTLDREVINLKDSLMPRFANLVYNGYWYSREMTCLLAFLKESQKGVNGTVNLELYKGNITIMGRSSNNSLYDEHVASMEDDHGSYNQADATGFIRLHSLPLRANARRMKKSSNK